MEFDRTWPLYSRASVRYTRKCSFWCLYVIVGDIMTILVQFLRNPVLSHKRRTCRPAERYRAGHYHYQTVFFQERLQNFTRTSFENSDAAWLVSSSLQSLQTRQVKPAKGLTGSKNLSKKTRIMKKTFKRRNEYSERPSAILCHRATGYIFCTQKKKKKNYKKTVSQIQLKKVKSTD